MKPTRINATITQNYFSANTLQISNINSQDNSNHINKINNAYFYRDINTHDRFPYGLYKIHQLKYDTNTTFGNTRFSFASTNFQDIIIRPNSILNVSIDLPLRNDNANEWGGAYVELLYRINGGTHITLGNSGYDGVMIKGAGAVLTYNNNFLLTPNTAPTDSNYYFGLSLRFHSYDIDPLSTDPKPLYLNTNHDINTISNGGNTYQDVTGSPGEYLNNFYTSAIILEYNRMRTYG